MKRLNLLVGVTLLLLSIPAWAQDTATLVGTVTDATGAVIPGAKVTVSNPLKGYTRQLIASSAGEYTAYKIPIGDYVVTAEAPGFQKLVRSGITLAVGQTLRVDLQMTLGQVTQEVTVTGNVARVETETSAISDVVTGQQISSMMMNGRNFVTLALLVPGAVADNGLDTSHVGVYGNNSISFNGGRMQYTNWEIDGGNNTDEGSSSTFNTYPNVDTIAEFRISTSNYGADMGKHAGATIEVATKSGTKDFHGDAFEYVRNDKFDANPWFQNRVVAPTGGNAPKTPRRWNDYGYTLGGPVYIPGHYNTDKSKTFFFWSEDWRKYREGQVISAGAPSLGERGGDFSGYDYPGLLGPAYPGSSKFNSALGQGIPPLLTAAGAPCNRSASIYKNPDGSLNGDYSAAAANCKVFDTVQSIPGASAQAFINGTALLNGLVPLPNNGVTGWLSSSSTATNWRQEQIRVDENISDKTSVFARWTQDAWDTVAVPSLWSWASYDTIKTPFGGPGKSAVIHITHSFKPNLMNEFVAGYTTDHIILTNLAADSVAGSIDRPSNFVMNHLFTANNTNTLLPAIALCGNTPYCVAEDASNHPWKNSNPILTWKDNLAWTRGAHTVKFGIFLENYRKNEQFGFDTQGFLSFFGGGTTSTGNALADMFLGRIDQYQEGTQTFNGVPVGGYPKGHWQMTALEPYIQDDWRVNHKLTLNLGLRYFNYTRIHDVSRPTIDSGFLPNQYNPTKEAGLNPDGTINQASGHTYTAPGNGLVICGTNGVPAGCQLNNTAKNFAPRFGFAYDPRGNGKTAIRGGYGVYFEMGNGNEAQTEGGEGNPPVALSPSGFNLGPTISQPNGYLNIVPGAIGPSGYTPIPYSQGWPYVQQFSLGIQHEFTGNSLLSVAYVGSLGRHLARARNINQIPIGVTTASQPALAGTTGCNATGSSCDVQTILINHIQTENAFFAPYSSYGNMFMKENTAVSSYHSLQVNYRHMFGHGLTFQTVYTWSHAIDDSTSTYQENSGGIDDYNLGRWKATSDLNRTHVLTLNYIYEVPFLKSSPSSILRQALGGWQISGITSLFTGEPIASPSGQDFNCGVSGFSSGIGQSVRCNTAGPVKIDKRIVNDPTYGPTLSWYDPTLITQPLRAQLRADNEPGMFGYASRNFLTGPGRNNWDMALLKDFKTPWFRGESSKLQFRLETFNTFNHPQWQYVNTGCLSSTSFGQPCTGASGGQLLGTVNGAWAARIMQMGMKFIF